MSARAVGPAPQCAGASNLRQSSNTSLERQIFRARLSKWSFTCGWVILLLLHVLCAGFYAGVAWIYYTAHTSNLWWLPGGLGVSIPLEDYAKVTYVHLAVASAHALLILRMLVASVLSRQLAFQLQRRRRRATKGASGVWQRLRSCLRFRVQASPAVTRTNQVDPVVHGTKSARSALGPPTTLTASTLSALAASDPKPPSSTTASIRLGVKRAASVVFGRYGLLGVESAHYDLLYLARELVQAVWQTSQAYWMSVLLTRHRINHLFVACIVANCWSTALLRFAWRKSENVLMERIVLLTSDMVLDLMATIALPIVLFVPYYLDFNTFISDFPREKWYDPKWFINMVFEFRMLLVQSWGDMVFRLGFAANLLSCMEVVKSLLEEPRARVSGSTRNDTVRTAQGSVDTAPQQGEAPGPAAPAVPAPATSCAAGSSATVTPETVLRPATRSKSAALLLESSRKTSKLTQLAHWVLVLLGATVIVLHLHAATKSRSELCVVEVRPWFTLKPACLYFELNCARANVSGSVSEFELLLRDVDSQALASLDIVQCPALEVSPRILDFQNLIVLTLSFSSIHLWETTAALDDTHHAHLRNINFFGTNFSDGLLPDGVLSPTFPKHVTQVMIVYSNLASVPDDLDTKWTGLTFFYCEMSELHAFPSALTRLPIVDLSLVGNHIREVPLEIFLNPHLFGIYLNANPISELPDTSIQLPKKFLAGEFYNTSLSALPSYFDEPFFMKGGFVGAGGTPMCESIEATFEVLATDVLATSSSSSAIATTASETATSDWEPSSLFLIDCSMLSSQRMTIVPFFLIKRTNLPDDS